MQYPVETFTPVESERLRPHVTNLDAPVFALVNLPETVKGALFARYSRYPGTLRRLFLDEFADSLPDAAASYDNQEGGRAADFYERILVGYEQMALHMKRWPCRSRPSVPSPPKP